MGTLKVCLKSVSWSEEKTIIATNAAQKKRLHRLPASLSAPLSVVSWTSRLIIWLTVARWLAPVKLAMTIRRV